MSEQHDELEYPSEDHLEALAKKFMSAVVARNKGQVDDCRDLLLEIVKVEPRLPEPHLELAHIEMESGALDGAEAYARQGIDWLTKGGQWLATLEAHELVAHAHDLLGEVLRRRATSDEVVFGPEELFRELLNEARDEFSKARELDPNNEHAHYNDFFLSLGEGDENDEVAGESE
jgi:hypothetical protein